MARPCARNAPRSAESDVVASRRMIAGLFMLLLCALLLGGCASIGRKQLDQAAEFADRARVAATACDQADACAIASPLRALGDRALAESAPGKPVNYVQIVEYGQDSLLGRINLIRSARSSIDVQTFILADDDAGYLFLNELIAAARRGVKVRMLVDQLNAPNNLDLLANLASAHANFQMRLYNPNFDHAHTSTLEYVAGVLAHFRRLNQRMHNKLMVVDGVVAFTGGRNIADDYFDWNPEYDFRDRDAILAGPEVRRMERVFEAFWNAPRSVPLVRLKDVAALLLSNAGPPAMSVPIAQQHLTPRVQAMAQAASDPADVQRRLVDGARAVSDVRYIGDGPSKQKDEPSENVGRTTRGLRALVEGAKSTVLMQTPYLVLSHDARELFRSMHKRDNPPKVTVSTNSLASTDAIPVYALSYKYKRRYLRELGFRIFELKPHPLDMPVDLDATGGGEQAPPPVDSAMDGLYGSKPNRLPQRSEAARFPGLGSRSGTRLATLDTHGVRIGMHAKSIVIDGIIGIIGSHNFDPRSDLYNTESVLVFHDEVLAARLQTAIERDIAPQNSWLIAKRPRTAISRFNTKMTELFENLPVFDIWPFRYATSYELNEDCDPVPPSDPRFQACWTPVGDFPEVRMSFKVFATRVLTAFGAGLAPIL
jgi:phosphatidylserine/phosphatidylglycerophosphate/cardiolipin synthase-like enzyme